MAGRGCKKIISPEDMAKAEEYALEGCKNNTIAKLMGWDDSLIPDRKDIQKRLSLKRAERDQKLRKLQFEQAKKYAPMTMFLGKNYLGQADKQEISGKDGAPLVAPVIQVMPSTHQPIPTNETVEAEAEAKPAITGQKQGSNSAQTGD
jgi:hypothetical protein